MLREADEWSDGGKHAEGLVRRGARLEAALALQAAPEFKAALAPAGDYLEASKRLETAGQRRGAAALIVHPTARFAGVIAGEGDASRAIRGRRVEVAYRKGMADRAGGKPAGNAPDAREDAQRHRKPGSPGDELPRAPGVFRQRSYKLPPST